LRDEIDAGTSRHLKEDLPRSEGFQVIRQAITCDICASEKRQTNHWFVAYEQAGELRVSGWNSRNRRRPGVKHLCGQTCLHKLVDEFMAKAIAVRPPHAADEDGAGADSRLATDTSLTSGAVYVEFESSARLITPPEPLPPESVFLPQPELLTMPSRPLSANYPLRNEERQRSASRNWRAEAWARERERELRAIENRTDIAARRHSSA
jgi:hypothetical protein